MSRNVEAMTAIYSDFLNAIVSRALGGHPAPTADIAGRVMAEFFAARGVLAVDSLTDEQVEEIHAAIEMEPRDHIAAGRAALRRCATGD